MPVGSVDLAPQPPVSSKTAKKEGKRNKCSYVKRSDQFPVAMIASDVILIQEEETTALHPQNIGLTIDTFMESLWV